MSNDLPPPLPVEYARAAPYQRIAPILSPRIALHCWAIAGATLMTSIYAIPKFESVFKDFKAELPTITKFTLLFSRALANDLLWIPAALCAIAFPFGLSALVGLGEPTREDVQRREKWICRGLRVLALVILLWLGLAIFQPYSALIDAVSAPRGR